MMPDYLIYNPIFLIFVSYTLGVWMTSILKATGNYLWFDDHYYLNDRRTKQIGVLHFGWLIRHSFMGMFNPKLKYTGNANREKLEELRAEMTFAEVNHLMAFIVLLVLNIVFVFWGVVWWYILAFFLLNLVFNFYLVLLQQFNKRRIDRILQSKRKDKVKK